MNTNILAKNYGQLSTEERFRLVVAATDRGDEVERGRLRDASPRLTYSNVDYSAFGHALNELAPLVMLELLEEAALRDEFLDQLSDAETTELFDGNKSNPLKAKAEGRSIKDRTLDLCLVQSFKLRTKAAGWMLFCKRMGFSPFGLWQYLPGFNRIEQDFDIVEGIPALPKREFKQNDLTAWVNRLCPADAPEVTETSLITPEGFADTLEAGFRERVEWWAGS